MRKYQLLIAAAVLLLDRVTKLLVLARLPEAHSVTIIPGLFKATAESTSSIAPGSA